LYTEEACDILPNLFFIVCRVSLTPLLV